MRIKWVIGKSLEIIITLIFGYNCVWNMVQNVKNLFLIEGIISSVEINDSGYTLTFYFLLSLPPELKTSLSTRDKESLLELWRYWRILWNRIFKSKAFYSCLLNHELWYFVYKIRDILGRKRQAKHSDCNYMLSYKRKVPICVFNPISS